MKPRSISVKTPRQLLFAASSLQTLEDLGRNFHLKFWGETSAVNQVGNQTRSGYDPDSDLFVKTWKERGVNC